MCSLTGRSIPEVQVYPHSLSQVGLEVELQLEVIRFHGLSARLTGVKEDAAKEELKAATALAAAATAMVSTAEVNQEAGHMHQM